MKIYLFPVVLIGFLITIILQGVTYSSSALQASRLEKQIAALTQKVDKLQEITEVAVTSSLKEKNKTALDSRSEYPSDVLGLSDNSTDTSLLTPSSLSETMAAISPTPTKSTTGSKIKLKSGWTKVDVYESAKASSKVLGQINAGVDYVVIQKSPDWYEIKLANQTSAWVQAQFIYEVN